MLAQHLELLREIQKAKLVLQGLDNTLTNPITREKELPWNQEISLVSLSLQIVRQDLETTILIWEQAEEVIQDQKLELVKEQVLLVPKLHLDRDSITFKVGMHMLERT